MTGLLVSLALAVATPAIADIGHGIRLHFVEQGAGPPLIFVYHAVAYSRRYNFPNHNPSCAHSCWRSLRPLRSSISCPYSS